jgi:hypothetical protein
MLRGQALENDCFMKLLLRSKVFVHKWGKVAEKA